MTLHYSGILMEWLEEAHPEFLALLGEMVGRGQVEVLGGGYYDPILPLIPMNDKLGQLEKMTTWLRVRFETRPRGCWIAEKVWEPSLASVLRASGMDYTFVDDGQFAMAGASEGALWQPAITEDQGKIISLLPDLGKPFALAATSTPADAIEFLGHRSYGRCWRHSGGRCWRHFCGRSIRSWRVRRHLSGCASARRHHGRRGCCRGDSFAQWVAGGVHPACGRQR